MRLYCSCNHERRLLWLTEQWLLELTVNGTTSCFAAKVHIRTPRWGGPTECALFWCIPAFACINKWTRCVNMHFRFYVTFEPCRGGLWFTDCSGTGLSSASCQSCLTGFPFMKSSGLWLLWSSHLLSLSLWNPGAAVLDDECFHVKYLHHRLSCHQLFATCFTIVGPFTAVWLVISNHIHADACTFCM